MSEMVERVAKAIAKAHVKAGASYDDMARAAIREMREPTEAMRDRYNDPEIVGYGPDGSDHDKVWQAGVDAALAP